MPENVEPAVVFARCVHAHRGRETAGLPGRVGDGDGDGDFFLVVCEALAVCRGGELVPSTCGTGHGHKGFTGRLLANRAATSLHGCVVCHACCQRWIDGVPCM